MSWIWAYLPVQSLLKFLSQPFFSGNWHSHPFTFDCGEEYCQITLPDYDKLHMLTGYHDNSVTQENFKYIAFISYHRRKDIKTDQMTYRFIIVLNPHCFSCGQREKKSIDVSMQAWSEVKCSVEVSLFQFNGFIV